MSELRAELTRYGVIANDEQRKKNIGRYIDQRILVSIILSVITVAVLIWVGFLWIWESPLMVLGCGIFSGSVGLATRSWSYLNQPESPFPPYVLTYPILVGVGCPFIVATANLAANSQHPSTQLLLALVAAPCFILGYGPMDFFKKFR